MKVDTAMKRFVDRYDEAAMNSIDQLIADRRIVKLEFSKFKTFNINESFKMFIDYLSGYSAYIIERCGKGEKLMMETYSAGTQRVINDKDMFVSKEVPYSDIPDFINGYADGCSQLLEAVNATKHDMMEAGVDQVAVAAVNDFADSFMEKMDEHLYERMDLLLHESGYMYHKLMAEEAAKAGSAPKDSFI